MTRYSAKDRGENYICSVGTEKEVSDVRSMVEKHVNAGETVKGVTKGDSFSVTGTKRGSGNFDVYVIKN